MKENIIIIENKSINLQKNKYLKYFLKYFFSDILIYSLFLIYSYYIIYYYYYTIYSYHSILHLENYTKTTQNYKDTFGINFVYRYCFHRRVSMKYW